MNVFCRYHDGVFLRKTMKMFLYLGIVKCDPSPNKVTVDNLGGNGVKLAIYDIVQSQIIFDKTMAVCCFCYLIVFIAKWFMSNSPG